MKIQNQTQALVCETQIRQQLHLVNRGKRLDSFDFHDAFFASLR